QGTLKARVNGSRAARFQRVDEPVDIVSCFGILLRSRADRKDTRGGWLAGKRDDSHFLALLKRGVTLRGDRRSRREDPHGLFERGDPLALHRAREIEQIAR